MVSISLYEWAAFLFIPLSVDGHLGFCTFCCYSVPQSMSNSFWPYGLQQARPLCPSPSPKVCPSSCPLHQWCHPATSSSDALFSFCPWSFPASGTYPVNQLFESYDQNTRVSGPASVLPESIHSWLNPETDWFELLAVPGTLQHHSLKASILWHSAFFMVQLSQPYMTTGKTIALTIQIFVSRVMSLLFNTLSRFVIAFLPRGKCLLISWLQSPTAVILEPKKRKPVITSTFPPLFAMR